LKERIATCIREVKQVQRADGEFLGALLDLVAGRKRIGWLRIQISQSPLKK
jgi:hypothetical protein